MSKHAISFKGVENLTRQSFKEECDVNNIVRTYARTGMVNHVARISPQYGEAPDIDFFDAACMQAEISSAEAEGRLVADEITEDSEESATAENPPENASEDASEAPQESPETGA